MRISSVSRNLFRAGQVAGDMLAVAKPVKHAKGIVVQSPETKITTLKSGIRVATEDSRIPTATVGVWIDGGSRYETKKTNGVAHFLEHMNFKGTRKRSQFELELEVENMGAHLNAYTSREQTTYFAKCFSQDTEKAVEILSDILLNSVYGSREIENERGVILREMEEVNQNMQEFVFDLLHAGAFKGCSLSGTILGPTENIKSLNRNDMLDYVRTFYKGQRMVLCGAGGVEHEQLVQFAEKYFGTIERGSAEVLKYEPGVFCNSYQIFSDKSMEKIFGCLSVEGTSWTHPDNIATQIVNMMLGSYDCTQGLPQGDAVTLLGEKAVAKQNLGVSSFMSFTTNYKDTGLTGTYFCVDDAKALEQFTETITDVWKKLCYEVDERKLNYAKRTMFLNSLLMLDGSTPICEDIGRQLLVYGRRMSVAELKARIDQVTPDTVMDLARKYYVNAPFAYTIVGGTRGWPTEDHIHDWLRL